MRCCRHENMSKRGATRLKTAGRRSSKWRINQLPPLSDVASRLPTSIGCCPLVGSLFLALRPDPTLWSSSPSVSQIKFCVNLFGFSVSLIVCQIKPFWSRRGAKETLVCRLLSSSAFHMLIRALSTQPERGAAELTLLGTACDFLRL
jgi:hypothetical protein